jgi:transglutaminase-like putative cysteine protease
VTLRWLMGLRTRQGVCQDFSHVFITLARGLGVPARYVSGYLYRDVDSDDRSADGATHAWVEVLLPDAGWVGLDPTNNLMAEDRHIRVAVGRDYADVPPSRGVYKGRSAVRSELSVAVRVGPVAVPSGAEVVPLTPWVSREAVGPPAAEGPAGQQAQQ